MINEKVLSLIIISLILGCNRTENEVSDQWNDVYYNENYELFNINFLNDSIGYVIGGLKHLHTNPNWQNIFVTFNGGQTWKEDSCIIAVPPSGDLIKQVFPSAYYLLGIGYNVYMSIDHGLTWFNPSGSQLESGGTINDLYISDSSTWLIGKDSRIMRTTDLGKTWNEVFKTQFMGPLHNFSFPTKETGYAFFGLYNHDFGNLSAALFLKTENNGISWEVMSPEPWKSMNKVMPNLVNMQFIDEKTGFIITDEYILYKTIDGGQNWELICTEAYCNGLMFFSSENLGYRIVGNSFYITEDAGYTWSLERTYESDILEWSFTPNGNCFAVTRNEKIIKRQNKD